ncbi:hypothetical protein ACROYT_G024396 [Oculina patagonica]
MQKGKATSSPPAAMVLQGRPPQQNPRGPRAYPSQQTTLERDDCNPSQAQFQIATFQLHTASIHQAIRSTGQV